MKVPKRGLSLFEVKVGAEDAIVLRKLLRRSNESPQVPYESCSNIINCLRGVEVVGKHHSVKSKPRLSITLTLPLSTKDEKADQTNIPCDGLLYLYRRRKED